ncbi:MAG: hypothetical protein NW200_06680 [Hyphomonadaceae bacterium]|nr:hypothetical protein [Hyphomonadaceae bacterium]
MRALTFFSPDTQRGGLRLIGFVVAVVSVILPAFPLGPLAAHPWTPMAVLWAAYGWASEVEEMERVNALRGARAPVTLAVLGLIQDQLAGGPIGLSVVLFLSAYLIGWVTARAMRSPNVWSLWAGFVAMCAGLCGVAALVAPWALGGAFELAPFAQACAVTAALFPFVRPLYMETSTV